MAATSGDTKKSKKNILLLIADDLGKSTGCYGLPNVSTPNIDALAAQGTKFDMAFASTASCSGSRSVMYTGLHSHENGMYGLQHGWNHFSVFDTVETAPLLFNSLGYQTGIIGKIHVGPSSAFPWEVVEASGTRNVAWVADRAEAFFEKAKATDRPFFLTVGYIDPHRDTTTRAGFGNAETCDGRIPVRTFTPDEVGVPVFLSDLPETRQELAEYYQSISRLDGGVGLMLQALERQGLADSTLVVFTSDNGPPFVNSKTTLYDAGVCLPLVVRLPGSGGGGGGVVSPNMVSYVDFVPTFLDWAGTPEPPQLIAKSPRRRGRSFLPIVGEGAVLAGAGEAAWQQHVFGSHNFHEVQNYWPTRFLRGRRFKYHRNIAWRLDFPFASDLYASLSFEGMRNAAPAGPVMVGQRTLASYLFRRPEELYDLEADPREVRNLAAEAPFRDVLLAMRRTLEEWQMSTNDPWLCRDGISLTVLRQYIETEGLRVPDRFDFDIEHPASNDVPSFVPGSLGEPDTGAAADPGGLNATKEEIQAYSSEK